MNKSANKDFIISFFFANNFHTDIKMNLLFILLYNLYEFFFFFKYLQIVC